MKDEWRETLVGIVKETGQELIEKADDIIGDNDFVTKLCINIHIPLVGASNKNDMATMCPSFDVHKEFISKKYFERYMEYACERREGENEYE